MMHFLSGWNPSGTLCKMRGGDTTGMRKLVDCGACLAILNVSIPVTFDRRPKDYCIRCGLSFSHWPNCPADGRRLIERNR